MHCLAINISADVPTIINLGGVQDKFYDDLNSIISATSHTDKLILLGGFNAKVGAWYRPPDLGRSDMFR